MWSVKCKKIFQKLKRQACDALILKYFDSNKQCFIEIDSSGYINAGVLSQQGDNGFLHPVAYFSYKMAPTKCSYNIYDKKLLATIRYFKKWQPELEGTNMLVQVLTDHKRLEYFMTTKKLTPR